MCPRRYIRRSGGGIFWTVSVVTPSLIVFGAGPVRTEHSGGISLFLFSAMTNARNGVRFDPFPNKAGDGWHLRAMHPNGLEEHITGFASAFEAIAWLGTSKHEDWLKARVQS